MQYIAETKNLRMSARKVRLVADAIRGKELPYVLSRLAILDKRASTPLKKTIESAIANAINNFKAKKEDLILKSIIVNEGTMLKRFHYAGRGRIRPYKRRSSHVRVILEGKEVMKVDIKKEEGGKKE